MLRGCFIEFDEFPRVNLRIPFQLDKASSLGNAATLVGMLRNIELFLSRDFFPLPLSHSFIYSPRSELKKRMKIIPAAKAKQIKKKERSSDSIISFIYRMPLLSLVSQLEQAFTSIKFLLAKWQKDQLHSDMKGREKKFNFTSFFFHIRIVATVQVVEMVNL